MVLKATQVSFEAKCGRQFHPIPVQTTKLNRVARFCLLVVSQVPRPPHPTKKERTSTLPPMNVDPDVREVVWIIFLLKGPGPEHQAPF